MTEKTDWKVVELDKAISFLAANLLRIMAGAGREMDLDRQLEEASKLANEVAATQQWAVADSAMVKALEVRWPHGEAKTEEGRDFNAVQHSMAWIVTYSLRIAAAKITGNNSEASKNERELHRCLRHYEDDQRERRERMHHRLEQDRRRTRKTESV